MGAGIATVGKRIYAAGLYWENSPSSGRLSQNAKEAARQPGQQADFFAIRAGNKDGRVPQFGLGQISAGHKAGMPSIAGCLANQQGGSWAGAFRLREGTVVVVVRDDLILPDGDQLYINESEARDRLLQEIGFGGVSRVFAPESWSVPVADSMPLSLLLDERRDIRLQAVAIPKKAMMIGAGIFGALLLILAGGWLYQERQAEKDQEMRNQQAAVDRMRQNLLPKALQSQTIEYPPPERKWEARPLPMDVVNSCKDGLKQVTAVFAGWRSTGVKCDGAALTLNWAHNPASFASPPDLGASVKVILNETGTTATATIQLDKIAPRGAENLMDPEAISRIYMGENWPGTLAVAPDDPPPPPPPGVDPAKWTPPPAPWIKRSFTLNVPELPSYLDKLIARVPGLVVQSVSFSGGESTGGNWVIEGVIYANRI